MSDECVQGGANFSENQAIISDITDLTKCYYGKVNFSENQAICSDGTSFNCFNGQWLAQGSPCGASDTIVNPNVEPADPDRTSENKNVCHR